MIRLVVSLCFCILSCSSAFQLMSYNLMQLSVLPWDQKQRAEAFFTFISTFPNQPDVIILQEASHLYAREQIHKLKTIYPHQTPVLGDDCTNKQAKWNSVQGLCKRPLTVFDSGVMVISKHPFKKRNALYFKHFDKGTFDALAAKGAIHVEVEVQKQFIYHVVGTHLQSNAGSVGKNSSTIQRDVRSKQHVEIREWLDTLSISKKEPVIIAGDMNVPLFPMVEGLTNPEVEAMKKNSKASMKFNPNDPLVKNKIGSDSCPNNWLVKYFRADLSFGEKVKCVEKTLDYILVRTDHLQEIAPSEGISIIPAKSAKKMYWKKLDRTFPFAVNGKSQVHNGIYQDISDHYPIVQNFKFYDTTKTSSATEVYNHQLRIVGLFMCLLVLF